VSTDFHSFPRFSPTGCPIPLILNTLLETMVSSRDFLDHWEHLGMFNTSTRWMFPHNSPIHSLTLQILGNYRCLRSLTEKTIDFTQNQGSPHSNGGPRPVARAAHVSVRQPVRGHEKKRTASGDQHWQWKSQLICTSQYIYINIFIYLFIYLFIITTIVIMCIYIYILTNMII